MPATEGFPFRRLAADHMIQGVSRVWWQMHQNFGETSGCSFQLQAGYAGTANATDWVDVGTPVTDAFYAEDDQQRLHGKRLLTYYRVVLTVGTTKYVSQPVSVHGELPEKDWVTAREIIRKERLRHNLVSRSGILLKRIRYGARCTECLDELTGEVTDSKCPTCQGTGFKVGYHPPVPLQCFDLTPETIAELRSGAQAPGQSRPTTVQARVIGFPTLSKEDIWVDARSDQRWAIHEIKHAAEIRGVPLVLTVTMSLLAYTHAAYRIQVGGEPDDHEMADLPGAGEGSEEVDHDHGAEDALAYHDADGCGIIGAIILAIPAADYEAGARDAASACAATTTMANGRWSYKLLLDPGDYVLLYEKTGEYGPDTQLLTVVSSTPEAPVAVSESSSSDSFWSSSSFGSF